MRLVVDDTVEGHTPLHLLETLLIGENGAYIEGHATYMLVFTPWIVDSTTMPGTGDAWIESSKFADLPTSSDPTVLPYLIAGI